LREICGGRFEWPRIFGRKSISPPDFAQTHVTMRFLLFACAALALAGRAAAWHTTPKGDGEGCRAPPRCARSLLGGRSPRGVSDTRATFRRHPPLAARLA
jgi:hypothetical protein